MTKILAFAGSNSEHSINQQLVQHAAALLNSEVEVLDITGWEIPLYSGAEEKKNGVPTLIQTLKTKIKAADILLISSPEHNSSIPAFFKNIVDWLSRMEGKTFESKPAFLMSTSPGGRGGQTNLNNLQSLYPWWGGGKVLGTFSLPSFYDQVQDGQLATEIAAELQTVLAVVENYRPTE